MANPPPDHGILAVRDGVEARTIEDADAAELAVSLLDRIEARLEVPPVDESERLRLRSLARTDETSPHWHAVLACRAREPTGYAGVVVPGGVAGPASGDVVVARDGNGVGAALGVLLHVVARLASVHGARTIEVWLRRATPAELAVAREEGFDVTRRLAVLGRALDSLPPVDDPSDVEIRGFRDDDADAVVDVLSAAYAGTPDGGWTRRQFDERRVYDWFDPTDLLVAETYEGIVAVHWTKRRDEATGEVYNLAVHPGAQGGGLGGAMLRAGLAHLAARGCAEVILWVDHANERGLRLYGAHGFETRWEDVALGRSL